MATTSRPSTCRETGFPDEGGPRAARAGACSRAGIGTTSVRQAARDRARAARRSCCTTARRTRTARSTSATRSTRCSRTSSSSRARSTATTRRTCRAGTATACRSSMQVEKKHGRVGAEARRRRVPRRPAASIAQEQVELQRSDFKRLGVLGDWDVPYLHDGLRATRPSSCARSAQIIRNGHLYKGVKPVHWCLDCRSALAEAEVEYEDTTSPAIDVRFASSMTRDARAALRRSTDGPRRRAGASRSGPRRPGRCPRTRRSRLQPDYRIRAALSVARAARAGVPRASPTSCSMPVCAALSASSKGERAGASSRAARSKACSSSIRSTSATCR